MRGLDGLRSQPSAHVPVTECAYRMTRRAQTRRTSTRGRPPRATTRGSSVAAVQQGRSGAARWRDVRRQEPGRRVSRSKDCSFEHPASGMRTCGTKHTSSSLTGHVLQWSSRVLKRQHSSPVAARLSAGLRLLVPFECLRITSLLDSCNTVKTAQLSLFSIHFRLRRHRLIWCSR